MHTSFSNILATLIKWPVRKLLKKMYNNIEIQTPDHFSDLETIKKNYPDHYLIFVCNHQSHLDYIVFNFLLHEKFHLKPFTAGGINLNLFLIGRLFKKLGCIFIRRRFNENEPYKITLKTYLKYLMEKNKNPLEFYYEGGRSRNGMLLTPKFGLFSFIVDNYLSLQSPPKVTFVPVAIVHEHLAEQNALAKEVKGKNKKSESFLQLISSLGVIRQNLGTVYIKVGNPIPFAPNENDREEKRLLTQKLAFDCHQEVAKSVLITPIGLLSSVLLSSHESELTWSKIKNQVDYFLEVAHTLKIFCSYNIEDLLQNRLKDLLDKEFLEELVMTSLNKTFYSLNPKKRIQLTYFKNTVLHHYFVPYLLYSTIREIQKYPYLNIEDFIVQKRNEYKFEFYLPSNEDIKKKINDLIRFYLNISVNFLTDLTSDQKNILLQKMEPFNLLYRYKTESYYLACLTFKHMGNKHFSTELFLNMSRELFILERKNGHLIKFEESYSRPVFLNTLEWALHGQLIEKVDDGRFICSNASRIIELVCEYKNNLIQLL